MDFIYVKDQWFVVSIVLFVTTFLFCRYSELFRSVLKSRSLMYLASLLSLAVVGAYLGQIVHYIAYPNYFEDIQASVATVSWLALHGQPMYPNWEIDGIYGLLYGPILFLINGL